MQCNSWGWLRKKQTVFMRSIMSVFFNSFFLSFPSFLILIIGAKQESPIRHYWHYFKELWPYWNLFFYATLFHTMTFSFRREEFLNDCPEKSKSVFGKQSKLKMPKGSPHSKDMVMQMNTVPCNSRRDLKQLFLSHSKGSIQSSQFSKSKFTFQWICSFIRGKGKGKRKVDHVKLNRKSKGNA